MEHISEEMINQLVLEKIRAKGRESFNKFVVNNPERYKEHKTKNNEKYYQKHKEELKQKRLLKKQQKSEV